MPYNVSNILGSLSEEAFQWICNQIPKSSHILELGSGEATRELALAGYQMTSIEHDLSWLHKYNSHYIHAPLRAGWYDPASLKELPGMSYELIIVDGPPAYLKGTEERRLGFLKNIGLFDTSKPILVDDCQRQAEANLLMGLHKLTQRPYTLHSCQNGKVFGTI